MPPIAAGILMYREAAPGIEVLLGHPGGPIYTRKDDGVWSIPKGIAEPGEDLLAAARREFNEETGFPAVGDPIALGEVAYSRRSKIVHVWAMRWTGGKLQPIKSNAFEMEWPPRSGRKVAFPEIDRAEFLDIATARRRIIPAQEPFLDRLLALLA